MTRLLLVVAACSSSTTPSPTAPPPPVGKLVATSELSGTVQEIRAAGTQVPLADLRAYLGGLGLPVSGTADIDISFDVPNGSAALIAGHAHVTCTKCRVGDDVAKLKLGGKTARTSAFAPDGLDFGHLDFDKLDVTLTVENGHAVIRKFAVTSPDVAIELIGEVDLATTIAASRVFGCLRFKPSPTLEKTQPKTFAVLSVTGAPLDEAGYYSIRLEGTIGDMKRLGQVCH